MYTLAAAIAAPVVGPDTMHQNCACAGLVVALPDGKLHLFAETVDELESLGWGILSAVEQIRKQPNHAHEHAQTPAGVEG